MIIGGMIAVTSDETSRNDLKKLSVCYTCLCVCSLEEKEKEKKRKEKEVATCRETYRILSRTPHTFNDS